MQPNILACVFIGVGTACVASLLVSRLPKKGGSAVAWLAVLGAVALSQKLRERSLEVSDQSQNRCRAVAVPVPCQYRAAAVPLPCRRCAIAMPLSTLYPEAGVCSHSIVMICRRHLENYARALLEPIPPNAIVITSYDMQWTAGRYLNVCEKYR
jgi:hypothetical protein